VLSTRTFWTFVREFSPLGLRANRVKEELSSIDTRTADGVVWSSKALGFLPKTSCRILALRGIYWHPLASRHSPIASRISRLRDAERWGHASTS